MDIYLRTLITTIIIIIVMSTLLRIKLFTWDNLILLIILPPILAVVVTYNESIGGILNVIILSLYLLIRKFKVGISIFIPLATYLLVIVADYIVSSLIRILFELPMPYYDIVDQNIAVYALISLFILFVAYGIAIILSRFINRKDFNLNKSKNFEITFIVYVVIAFIVVYTIVRSLDNTNEIVNFGIYLLCYSALAITMVITYKYEKKEIRIKAKETEQENLKRYTSELEVLINEINRVMHENNNIILTITHYIETNNMPELADYFNKKVIQYKNKHVVNESNLKALSNIIDPEIKSLVYCKLIQANEKELNPILEVHERISFDEIDKIDLSRMLGILLDNAIEGAQASENPKIRIGILSKNNLKLLIVNNTCSENTPPLYKIFENSSSSKNKTGKGNGLSNLNQIIERNSNVYLKTEIKDQIFSQCIQISEDESSRN